MSSAKNFNISKAKLFAGALAVATLALTANQLLGEPKPADLSESPFALTTNLLTEWQDGDVIEIDARQDLFHLHLTQEQLALRSNAHAPRHHALGYGLELFAAQRRWVGPADQGASFLIED